MTLHAAKWAIAGLALTVSLFSQAPTNSLVAHFKLDGSLRDETGTVTGGVNGGATFVSDRFGRSSGAAYFDGRSYINFGNVSILNGATEATWSFWMRTSQRAPQSGYISVLRKDRAWLPLQGAQDIPPGTWRSPMYFEGKPEWSGPNYGQLPQISDGTWHMFTVVFGAGSLRTFIDGNLIQAISTYGTVPSGALQTSTNPFSLGASFDSGSPADCYVGNLDDIRIYRRALTPTEVAQLYQSESTPTTSPTTSAPDLTTGLIGRYPLDGDGRDLSSSGNNLVLNGVQPTPDRNGTANGAVYLNGTSAWMVTSADVPISGAQPRTVSVWIKSDALSFYKGAPVIIGQGDKSGIATLFDLSLEVVPESWTGRIVNPNSEQRSQCQRSDVSTVPI
jgi:hypothetical protein